MKFKIGDWIRSKDGLDTAKVTNSTMEFYKEGFDIALEDEWELWQPQEGEWCWHNSGSFVKCENYISKDKFEGTYLGGCDAECYVKDCEPFIGELPSFIKE